MKTFKTIITAAIICTFAHLPICTSAQVANGTGAGNCLNYDGVNDYVSAPDAGSLDLTTSFTLEAWVNLASLSNGDGQAIISKVGGVGGNNGYQFGIGNDSKIYLQFNASSEGWSTNQLGVYYPFSINTWVHLAGTYDNNYLRVYANGYLIGSLSVGSKTVVNSSSSLRISGDDNNHVYFNGKIEEARIWNVARTETEIRDNMCKKLTGSESGLVGYWRFDEGSGGTAYDASPSGNNGTLY